ncbi:ornithine carbamoyltransferase [Brevundimonas sp. S30B]|uniref:ornithine carbamoyltransferase n=1 Tax=unclassified Brevundimonas TaxID=2622653 RepID=UPI001071B5CF|nr:MULTISPECIES: ornithine carbamoyltransferase [unclassified Brevundimonas]QBX37123.1 ornithine carbamoyltransferase [Brevundimonas sp. MF30-B]TFW04082.1 ornithine carbamoyltransferase [Brevundimonas sp. S30B]
MVRHFLDIHRLSAEDLRAILDDAHARKQARQGWPKGRVDADAPARDRVLAMVFEKNSTRTRFSFDAAIRQLGGSAIIANAADMQLGRGEPVEDTAKVLSRMVDAVMIRANDHEDVERFARVSTVPVINALTDRSHPCQILADLLTIEEHRGPVKGKTIAWVGDGNNVCHSFMHAAPKLGFTLNVACPAEYHPDLRDLAKGGDHVHLTSDPREAVRGADVVVTDTWVSMGDQDYEDRLAAFEAYGVDDALMDEAAEDAVFLHCLPAHRGEEVSDAVIDGPRSLVWDEAENRIHAQKAVLAWCFGQGGD